VRSFRIVIAGHGTLPAALLGTAEMICGPIADIAAVGLHGRGYRRVRFVFDTVEGTPKIIYRQDLTHLGWALGKDARQNLLTAKGTR